MDSSNNMGNNKITNKINIITSNKVNKIIKIIGKIVISNNNKSKKADKKIKYIYITHQDYNII